MFELNCEYEFQVKFYACVVLKPGGVKITAWINETGGGKPAFTP